MERMRLKLQLTSLHLFKLGRLKLSLNRTIGLFSLIVFAELCAGAGTGILIWAGAWWIKILATLLFLGFLISGARALILVRKSELEGMINCLTGLSEEQMKNRVYFDQPEGDLGKVGYLLNQLLDHCEESLDKQRRLIGAISHDLRTPLTIIRGDMEVALLRPRPAEEYQEILESNLEEVDRISRLVEDLLTVSKAEAGELRMVFRPENLTQLLAGLYSGYKKIASKKGRDLTMEAENDIITEIDEHRIKQMVANLIENAIQYTPVGRKIDLILRRGEKEAWLLVRDQGIGISPEELPFIFEPFYRGSEAKRLVSKGYGLGLSICKQIANAHNGEIDVESRVGPESGTTFRLRLPAQPRI